MNKKYPVQRNLDGVFYRQKRGKKFCSICFTDLTQEEQQEILKEYSPAQLCRMAYLMADVIKKIDEQIDCTDEEKEEIFKDADRQQFLDAVHLMATYARKYGDVLDICTANE